MKTVSGTVGDRKVSPPSTGSEDLQYCAMKEC